MDLIKNEEDSIQDILKTARSIMTGEFEVVYELHQDQFPYSRAVSLTRNKIPLIRSEMLYTKSIVAPDISEKESRRIESVLKKDIVYYYHLNGLSRLYHNSELGGCLLKTRFERKTRK